MSLCLILFVCVIGLYSMKICLYQITLSTIVRKWCASEINNSNVNNEFDISLLCFKHTYVNKSKVGQCPCSRQRLRPSDPGHCPVEIGYQPISQKVRQHPCSRQGLRPSEPGFCLAIQTRNHLVKTNYLSRYTLKIRLYICTGYSALAFLVAYSRSITRL